MFLIEFLIKPRGSITTEGSGKGHTGWQCCLPGSTRLKLGLATLGRMLILMPRLFLYHSPERWKTEQWEVSGEEVAI